MTQIYTLSAMADRQAIADLIYRYCRSVDRLDIALGHSIWHEDGIADYGAAVYQGPAHFLHAGQNIVDLSRQHGGPYAGLDPLRGQVPTSAGLQA